MIKILYFWASWCGPCKAFGPMIQSISEELGCGLEKIDGDENSELVTQYVIRSFPTIILLDKNGNEVGRHSGLVPKEKLKGIVTHAISKG